MYYTFCALNFSTTSNINFVCLICENGKLTGKVNTLKRVSEKSTNMQYFENTLKNKRILFTRRESDLS